MYKYSQDSLYQLSTCEADLRKLFFEVIKYVDCKIIQGHRTIEDQLKAFESGNSKVKFGLHNYEPSKAVDAAPFLLGRGIPWPKIPDWNDKVSRDKYLNDLHQFYYFAGLVIGIAKDLNINIRWGGDWDRDNDLSDQSFNDLVHFELIM